MAKKRTKRDDFDSPWKEALQAYLPFFLAFFFPDIHPDIDWERGYESLDKEFQQITREAKIGKLLADKLFKVWLKDGNQCWLLIHVEIQGEREQEFPERMLDYHIAIRRLYNQKVVSLAILCDDSPDWKPTSFAYEQWGCRLELTYRMAKVLDFQNDAALEVSDNPFAHVVLAHLRAIETRGNPQTRGQWKLQVVKGLYRGKLAKGDVRQIVRLIDWVMTLPDDLEEIFRAAIYQFEEEKRMKYITTFERAGIRQGLLEGIDFALDAKFGAPGRKLLRKAETLKDIDDLREFARFLQKAATLKEVREYFR